MTSDSFDFSFQQNNPKPAAQSAAAPTAPAAAAVVPDERLRQNAALRGRAEAGEIFMLMARCEPYMTMPLSRVDQLVRTILATRQFAIVQRRAQEPGKQPSAALAFWAFVSDEIDAELSAGGRRPYELSPKEWQSGSHTWLVDALGERGATEFAVAHAAGSALKGRAIKIRMRNQDGSWETKVLPPRTAPPRPAGT